ncbi:YceI family protein [Bacteroidetes/Chlorobi group bacterium ChocPot_Mid]|nr:MAG: YceI family protein [Bacteroidetes/Chlorobi group bacterium ChocPot_Mid]
MKNHHIIYAIFFISIILSANQQTATAQEKYVSKNGHIWFYSQTPLETIEAHNNQVATIINIKTGAIAFDLLMKSFKFKKALMEEHFNENYVHSETYPKCTFSGKIVDINNFNLTKNGKYKVEVEGDLTMHGVTKKIKQTGTLEVKDDKIYATSKFDVKPEDYNIEIPKLVRDKIASTIEVNVDIVYQLFEKR